MKTTVLYHRSDFDGIFCREIARKFLPTAELIGWDYGDPIPAIPPMQGEEQPVVYMLDISIDGLMDYPGLIWIDHHKSAIDKFPKETAGYRIDGVAACRLAWQWFANMPNSTPPMIRYPKEDFIDRRVSEPMAVRLAGEYDIWDKRDPNAELFQMGLRTRDLETCKWGDRSYWEILRGDNSLTAKAMINDRLTSGTYLQYGKREENESIIKAAGFTIDFEGLRFLACNHARYNSFLFTAGLRPEHDACFGFAWREGQWTVSLYHAPGKEHHDVSKIAVKYGGGGHRGACGFRVKTLPFLS